MHDSHDWQLIRQVCRRELPVQGGAALREHAGVSAFGQCAERGRQVHIPLPGDDHLGEVGGLLALVRRRCNTSRVAGTPLAIGDDNDRDAEEGSFRGGHI
jgi:hypothetical protein